MKNSHDEWQHWCAVSNGVSVVPAPAHVTPLHILQLPVHPSSTVHSPTPLLPANVLNDCPSIYPPTHLVQLDAGELGVVPRRDALVAEDAPNLKHALQAAHLAGQ